MPTEKKEGQWGRQAISQFQQSPTTAVGLRIRKPQWIWVERVVVWWWQSVSKPISHYDTQQLTKVVYYTHTRLCAQFKKFTFIVVFLFFNLYLYFIINNSKLLPHSCRRWLTCGLCDYHAASLPAFSYHINTWSSCKHKQQWSAWKDVQYVITRKNYRF